MKSKYSLEDIKNLIPDYLNGMLSDEEKLFVEKAIHESDELKSYVNSINNTFEFLNSVELNEPNPNYWNTILPNIHNKIEISETKKFSLSQLSSLWKVLVPVAAVILLFVFYYINYFNQENNNLPIVIEDKISDSIKISSDSDNLANEDKSISDDIKDSNLVNKNSNISNIKRKYKLNFDNELKSYNNDIYEGEVNTNNSSLEVKQSEAITELDYNHISFINTDNSFMFDEDIETELKEIDKSDYNNFLEDIIKSM